MSVTPRPRTTATGPLRRVDHLQLRGTTPRRASGLDRRRAPRPPRARSRGRRRRRPGVAAGWTGRPAPSPIGRVGPGPGSGRAAKGDRPGRGCRAAAARRLGAHRWTGARPGGAGAGGGGAAASARAVRNSGVSDPFRSNRSSARSGSGRRPPPSPSSARRCGWRPAARLSPPISATDTCRVPGLPSARPGRADPQHRLLAREGRLVESHRHRPSSCTTSVCPSVHVVAVRPVMISFSLGAWYWALAGERPEQG